MIFRAGVGFLLNRWWLVVPLAVALGAVTTLGLAWGFPQQAPAPTKPTFTFAPQFQLNACSFEDGLFVGANVNEHFGWSHASLLAYREPAPSSARIEIEIELRRRRMKTEAP